MCNTSPYKEPSVLHYPDTTMAAKEDGPGGFMRSLEKSLSSSTQPHPHSFPDHSLQLSAINTARIGGSRALKWEFCSREKYKMWTMEFLENRGFWWHIFSPIPSQNITKVKPATPLTTGKLCFFRICNPVKKWSCLSSFLNTFSRKKELE